MSKHNRLERLTVADQRRKTTETQPLEPVNATVRESSSRKSAWSLTKIQASGHESLK